ncbi:MAG: signal peptidase I, partial [Bdellovibrionaceae bacterium]|nr:signal peptidase I [Pseudobdellovibrionaceae bacterium]
MAAKVPAKIVLREYLESLIVAVIVALLLRFFVISAYKIPTGSMVPTLMAGDFIFAYKLPYGVPVPFTGQKLATRPPARGDVVVFRPPGNESVNYIKRVVGLPGERIEIRQKKLFINDRESTYEALGETHIRELPGHEYFIVYNEAFS